MAAPLRNNDNFQTDFQNWRRHHPLLQGPFSWTDIDGIWSYKDCYMLIELKCHRKEPTVSQRITFRQLDKVMDKYDLERGYQLDHNNELDAISDGLSRVRYYGFHLLEFENTSPLNGRIWWDGEEISVDDLVRNLRFMNPDLIMHSYDW